VHVVHNAAGRDFRPLRDEKQRAHLQQKYHLPPRFVLFVGTIEPRKNLLRLISAFGQTQRDHPDCHLVLVGPEGWLMNGALEKETAAADLTGKVHYLGIGAAGGSARPLFAGHPVCLSLAA
jgi:glycosyltransferase involved in cell wall biosynthesis